jgi:hypothetical protein
MSINRDQMDFVWRLISEGQKAFKQMINLLLGEFNNDLSVVDKDDLENFRLSRNGQVASNPMVYLQKYPDMIGLNANYLSFQSHEIERDYNHIKTQHVLKFFKAGIALVSIILDFYALTKGPNDIEFYINTHVESLRINPSGPKSEDIVTVEFEDKINVPYWSLMDWGYSLRSHDNDRIERDIKDCIKDPSCLYNILKRYIIDKVQTIREKYKDENGIYFTIDALPRLIEDAYTCDKITDIIINGAAEKADSKACKARITGSKVNNITSSLFSFCTGTTYQLVWNKSDKLYFCLTEALVENGKDTTATAKEMLIKGIKNVIEHIRKLDTNIVDDTDNVKITIVDSDNLVITSFQALGWIGYWMGGDTF